MLPSHRHPVSKRIFRHWCPMYARFRSSTRRMNLGNIIINEATLSFLGLGVKYPRPPGIDHQLRTNLT